MFGGGLAFDCQVCVPSAVGHEMVPAAGDRFA